MTIILTDDKGIIRQREVELRLTAHESDYLQSIFAEMEAMPVISSSLIFEQGPEPGVSKHGWRVELVVSSGNIICEGATK